MVYTREDAERVIKAIKEYAKKKGIEIDLIAVVGGVARRGYSLKDIDIVIAPEDAWLEIDSGLGEIKRITGVSNIDILPFTGQIEEEWLFDMIENSVFEIRSTLKDIAAGKDGNNVKLLISEIEDLIKYARKMLEYTRLRLKGK